MEARELPPFLQDKTAKEVAKSLKADLEKDPQNFIAILKRMIALAHQDEMTALLVEAEAFISKYFDFSDENNFKSKVILSQLPEWALRWTSNIVLACRAIYHEAIQRAKKEMSTLALEASTSRVQPHQEIVRNFFLSERAIRIRKYRQAEEKIDRLAKHQALQTYYRELKSKNLSAHENMLAKIDSQCEAFNTLVGKTVFPAEFFSESRELKFILENLYNRVLYNNYLLDVHNQFSLFHEAGLTCDFIFSVMAEDEESLEECLKRNDAQVKMENREEKLIFFCRFFGLLTLPARCARPIVRKIMVAYDASGHLPEGNIAMFFYFLKFDDLVKMKTDEEKFALLTTLESNLLHYLPDSRELKRVGDFLEIIRLYIKKDKDKCIEALFPLVKQASQVKPEDPKFFHLFLSLMNQACSYLLIDGYAGDEGKEKALDFFASEGKQMMIYEVYLLMKILAYQNPEVTNNIRNYIQDTMQFPRKYFLNIFQIDFPNLFFKDDILNRVRNRNTKETSEQAIKDLTDLLPEMNQAPLMEAYHKIYVHVLDIIKPNAEVKLTQTAGSFGLFPENKAKTTVAEPSQTIERQQPGMK